MAPKTKASPLAERRTFGSVLDAAEPRPSDAGARDGKKNYAEKLSNEIAVWLADELRATDGFHGILPKPDGAGRESKVAAGATKKPKKTDVRFGTADTGLELLVSIKTLSFRDAKKVKGSDTVLLGRYTKNMVRNDHELRAEAMDLHERFPFAVLIAILFLPFGACDDGDADKSSFAHAVMTLRPRSGRNVPSDPQQLFERVFIGLYEHEGAKRGAVSFFDVTTNPPKRGRPKTGLVDTATLVREIVKAYGIRNRRYMDWADEPSSGVLLEASEDDDSDEVEG